MMMIVVVLVLTGDVLLVGRVLGGAYGQHIFSLFAYVGKLKTGVVIIIYPHFGLQNDF